jgi:hypothetical protein
MSGYEPRIVYMHVHGHGTSADLARELKPALDLIGKGAAPRGTPPAAASATSSNKLDAGKIAQIVGIKTTL